MARHGRWIGLTAGLLAFAVPSAVLFGQQTGAQKAFKRVAPSVVSLENEEGSGTGIVLDKNGLILTNAHVVASPIPFRRIDAWRRVNNREDAVTQK